MSIVSNILGCIQDHLRVPNVSVSPMPSLLMMGSNAKEKTLVQMSCGASAVNSYAFLPSSFLSKARYAVRDCTGSIHSHILRPQKHLYLATSITMLPPKFSVFVLSPLLLIAAYSLINATMQKSEPDMSWQRVTDISS